MKKNFSETTLNSIMTGTLSNAGIVGYPKTVHDDISTHFIVERARLRMLERRRETPGLSGRKHRER